MSGVLDRLAERFVAAWGWGLPNWEGNFMDVGIFTPGLEGVARPVPWEAFASASAPLLPDDVVHFAVTADRQTVTRERVPHGAAAPLVDSLAEELEPPFCAVAVHDEGDVWAAAANRAEIVHVELPGSAEIEISRIGGVSTTRVDRAESDLRFAELEALLDREGGDATVVAHRFAGSTWIADVFPL